MKKEIIWRTWGSDQFFRIQAPRFSILHIKLNLYLLHKRNQNKRLIKSLKAVGVQNSVDKLILKKYHISTKNIIPLPYPLIENDFIPSAKNHSSFEAFNIMVGHSGFENDSHSLF